MSDTCSKTSHKTNPEISQKIEGEYINYIYVNSELVKLVKQKLKKSANRLDFTFHYLYICHVIGELQHSHKKFKDREYANIHYKTITSVVSKYKYTKIIANLKNWGVIACNNKYQPGKESKGYKLLPPYNRPDKRVKINDNKLNMKLSEFKMKSQKELNKLPQVYNDLEIRNSWIKLDYKTSTTYNNAFYFTQSDTYNSNLYSISAYRDGNYRFLVDKSNRIHTNLTNLKSDLRRFLSVQGEKLGQVDITNSQPLFLYLIIKDETEIPQDEKETYRALVENGKFYEYFFEKLNLTSDKRDEVKEMTYKYIFYGETPTYENTCFNIFREDFPNIVNFIADVKKSDYKQLAFLLQKAESTFVIEKVASEFIRRNETTTEFMGTIHDSIVVKASKLDQAVQVMKECFHQEGINPLLKHGLF